MCAQKLHIPYAFAMKRVGKSLFTEMSVVLKIIDCPILERITIAGKSSGYEASRNRYMNPPANAATDATLSVSFIEV